MSELMHQLAQWIEGIIVGIGYPGILLVMLVENLFPPIPSELVMPYAGFLVAQGQFAFPWVVISGTLGSVLGAIVLYYIGVWADDHVVRTIIRRFGRILMISEADLDKAMAFFDRHGEAVVFFGRLIPLVRSLISIPAGMDRMPMGKFLLFTALGSAIWTTLLTTAGYVLGANWEDVLVVMSRYQRITLIGLAVVAVGGFIWRFYTTRNKPARQGKATYDMESSS